MDSLIILSNNRKSIIAMVKDYKMRMFILKILKYVHNHNLSYIRDLTCSFVELS